ncbi:MAG: hypothetical protein E7510_07310 [Ruminococcus sp.]|nr:hypothetical protein [Ruminococcus sp.]
MKRILILMLFLVLEVFFCIFLCIKIDDNKYDKWLETDAEIVDIDIIGKQRPVRSNQSPSTYILVKYLGEDNLNFIWLDGYNVDCKIGDVLTIKYNPDSPGNIIYQPYEDHCVFVERRNTIIFFSVLIILTLVVYWFKKEFGDIIY